MVSGFRPVAFERQANSFYSEETILATTIILFWTVFEWLHFMQCRQRQVHMILYMIVLGEAQKNVSLILLAALSFISHGQN